MSFRLRVFHACSFMFFDSHASLLCYIVFVTCPCSSFVDWVVLCFSLVFISLMFLFLFIELYIVFAGASWGCLDVICGAIGGFLGLLRGSWEFAICRQHGKRQSYTQRCETSGKSLKAPIAASRIFIGRNLADKRVQGRC